MAYLLKMFIDNPVSIAPGFVIENVYVLPGVPKSFKLWPTKL